MKKSSFHSLKITVIFTVIFLLANVKCWSQNAAVGYDFYENKGQWPEQVNFKADLRAGYLYLENDGLLFNLYDASEVNKYVESHYNKGLRKELDELDWHSYKVNFVGSNETYTISKKYETPHYQNYYLGDNPELWAESVYGYKEVVYEDIYKSIDFVMHSRLFDLKYDFVIKPGGDPNQVRLSYTGQDDVKLKNGKLLVSTSVNQIVEKEPYVYQVINGKRKEVKSQYVLEDNELGFEILEEYDFNQNLIIDPTLIFSTYSGSFSNNFGYTATFDSKGFLYSGSSAFGNLYPTTLGSYSTSFNGGIVDMAISKFDTTGTFLIYSTFIGGSSDELPHSLIVNSADELFIFGTTSSTNYPYTAGCYDSTFNGGTSNNLTNGLGVDYVNGSDIVVSRLSADGTTLQASTYLGGSLNDGLNSTSTIPAQNILRYNYADEVRGEVDIDQNNNIYIATCTQSADFPISNGSFQEQYGGGDLDGIVVKMDNNLENIIWSSYIGGEKHDAVYALALDDNDDLYVTGGTSSDSLFTTQTALDTNYQGGRSDGFVTHISSDGSSIINATYIGSSEYDQSYFVELDRSGNIYLLGQTEITDSTFVKNVTWSNFGSGQFVAKLSPELDTLLYSTVFGSGNGINISPTAFLVDLCSKMYLAGWGGSVNNLTTLDNNAGSTSGMPVTADAFQSATDGSDFYVMVLEDDASVVVYGSYFGSPTAAEHVDGGTSRFDRKGKVYQAMCAGCGGDDNMPIFPLNAVSDSNQNSCNLGVFKMDFNLPIVLADFDAPEIGCAPYNAQFTNTSLSQLNTTFSWDFGDNGTSNVENPLHIYQNPGTYQVTLILRDTATCNFGDTLTKEVIIIGDTTYTLGNFDICPGETVQIGLLPNNDTSLTYLWSPNTDLSNDSISNPFTTPSLTTNYQLLISNGICTDTVLQTVEVNTPLLNVSPDTILCSNNETVTLVANSLGSSNDYVWSLTSNFIDTLNSNLSQTSLTVSPDSNTTYYVQINNNGCTLWDSINVGIAANQIQLQTDQFICLGDSSLIVASSVIPNQNFTYDWYEDSLLVSVDFDDSITVLLSESGYVYLTAVAGNGCAINDSIYIDVDDFPNISINATTEFDTIIEGGSSGLNIEPSGYSYSWYPNTGLNDPNIQSPLATPYETTIYSVTVNSDNGCVQSDNVIIHVKEFVCGEPDLYIPNAFTPNQDGINDKVFVRGNNVLELTFRIYDRWGELVWETFDQSQGWDGTFKGKALDPAVFDYYVEITCVGNETYFKKGNITLIR